MENKNKILVQVDEFEGLIKCDKLNVLLTIVHNQEFLDCIGFNADDDLLVKNLTYDQVIKTINKYFDPSEFNIERVGTFSPSELSVAFNHKVSDVNFIPGIDLAILIKFEDVEISIDEEGIDING